MTRNINKTFSSLALTAVLGAFSASALANYSFNFDGVASGTSANNSVVNPYSDVSFLSGFVAADLDTNGFEILDMNNQTIPGFTHWETYQDSDIRVRDPQFYGAGVAPSGTNAIDAKFEQVFIKFSTAQNLTSFSMQLDNSTFGFPNSNLFFVDSFGKALSTVVFDQSQSGSIIIMGAVNNVSGIILSSGKLYDNINIATVAAVPEPESYAMLLAGLAVVGAVSRRKK
jgi:PEP-CTERM motif